MKPVMQFEALSPAHLKPPILQKIGLAFQRISKSGFLFQNLELALCNWDCWWKTSQNSRTQFHNYKGFFILELLSICDAKYCFTFVDLSQCDSNNVSEVFSRDEMNKQLSSCKGSKYNRECVWYISRLVDNTKYRYKCIYWKYWEIRIDDYSLT